VSLVLTDILLLGRSEDAGEAIVVSNGLTPVSVDSRFFMRRRRRRKMMRMTAMIATTPTDPTAMPAIAPVESRLVEGAEDGVSVIGPLVGGTLGRRTMTSPFSTMKYPTVRGASSGPK
jgi:hypothetical protein